MFGSMERLEEGKKVSGWIMFPSFGTTIKRERIECFSWDPRAKPFCAGLEGKVKKGPVFIGMTKVTLRINMNNMHCLVLLGG